MDGKCHQKALGTSDESIKQPGDILKINLEKRGLEWPKQICCPGAKIIKYSTKKRF